MRSKLTREKMKAMKVERKLKEKKALLAFKKYFELTKKVGKGTLLEDGAFVYCALAKIDGHYFFPVDKDGEKRIRIIRVPDIKHNIFTIDVGLAEGGFWPVGRDLEYLCTEVEEDAWDMTFNQNGKPRGIVDVLHGHRDLGRIYLGEITYNDSGKRRITLEEAVENNKAEINAKVRKHLEGSMCSTIEDLLKEALKQKKKSSR